MDKLIETEDIPKLHMGYETIGYFKTEKISTVLSKNHKEYVCWYRNNSDGGFFGGMYGSKETCVKHFIDRIQVLSSDYMGETA